MKHIFHYPSIYSQAILVFLLFLLNGQALNKLFQSISLISDTDVNLTAFAILLILAILLANIVLILGFSVANFIYFEIDFNRKSKQCKNCGNSFYSNSKDSDYCARCWHKEVKTS
jgi:ribosomal protein S27AE